MTVSGRGIARGSAVAVLLSILFIFKVLKWALCLPYHTLVGGPVQPPCERCESDAMNVKVYQKNMQLCCLKQTVYVELNIYFAWSSHSLSWSGNPVSLNIHSCTHSLHFVDLV